eukprot:6127196-Amphidinium_carterae.3
MRRERFIKTLKSTGRLHSSCLMVAWGEVVPKPITGATGWLNARGMLSNLQYGDVSKETLSQIIDQVPT